MMPMVRPAGFEPASPLFGLLGTLLEHLKNSCSARIPSSKCRGFMWFGSRRARKLFMLRSQFKKKEDEKQGGEKTGKMGLSRSFIVALIIIAIIIVPLSGIFILLQSPAEEAPLTILQLTHEKKIIVAENGDASLDVSVRASHPTLVDMYENAFEMENLPAAEPITHVITHIITDDFLMGEIENLTVENDEATLSTVGEGVYHQSGALTSPVLFFAETASVTVSWNASVPPGTTLTVKVSNDNGSTWENVENGVLHTFTSPENQAKYKIEFRTDEPSLTPTLDNITLTLTSESPSTTSVEPQQAFNDSLQEEHRTLHGLETVVTETSTAKGNPENEFTISSSGIVLGAAEFDEESSIWVINIGPQGENDANNAIGFMVTQLMFTHQMIESLPENHLFEYTSTTSITLPENAEIVNSDELSGLSWRVDFGGGTYKEASVTVDENSHTVTLNDKMVVTEQTITRSPENFLVGLFDYGFFTIIYTLGGEGSSQSASGNGSLTLGASGVECGSNDWSKTWTHSLSHTFSKEFGWSGTYHGASASASVTISAEPRLSASWYMGWHFYRPHWYSWPKLKWFKTYFEITPSVTVDLNASVTAGVSKSWSHTYHVFHHKFHWWIGVVPVWANLKFDVIPGVDFDANASVSLDVGVGASATGKFGVEWRRHHGWRGIKSLSHNFSHSGPSITGEADITATSYVELKLSFILYDAAGPYMYIKPKAKFEASYPERTWSIDAGFDINAGVGMGKLAKWVGLHDWEPSHPLYSWLTTLWSGTW